MYLISMESFKSLIRNKWQAWSLAIPAKRFMLNQKCQVKGRILNTETILFLTKTWCFESIKKISKHHSLPLLLKLEAVWFDGNTGIWEGRVLRPALSLLCCGTGSHPNMCLLLGTSAFKTSWSCENRSLLARGVGMANELHAHLRNEGLQGTLGLHLTHFSNCPPRKSWAYPCPCCALQPHQVWGQNQTQPIHGAAALLPLFIQWKKPQQWAPSTWGYSMLEPWVSL